MTRTRVIAALVMAPVAMCSILFLPTAWLASLTAIIFLWGLWEWMKLSQVEDTLVRTVLLTLNLLLMVLLVWVSAALTGAVSDCHAHWYRLVDPEHCYGYASSDFVPTLTNAPQR